MAFLNIIGFETGDFSEVHSTGGTASIQSSIKRTGTYALKVNPSSGSGNISMRGLAADGSKASLDKDDLYCTFYLRIETAPDVELGIFQIQDQSGRLQYRVKLNTDRTMKMYYQNGSDAETAIGSASAAIALDTWVRIDFKSTAVSSGGSSTFEFKIDDLVISSATGLTITTATQTTRNAFFGNTPTQGTFVAYFDDLAISDSAYPGEGEVNRMDVDGTGTADTWTASAGNKEDTIDEIPHNSDTDYISVESEFSAQGQNFSLVSSSAAGVGGTIGTVKSVSIVRRVTGGSGLGTNNTGLYSSGTTDTTSNTTQNPTSYELRAKIFAIDPADSGAWDTDALDSLEVVGGRTSNWGAKDSSLRVTMTSVMVWSTGATPVIITPGVLAHSTTTYAPSVILGTIITPGVLDLSDIEHAPSVQTPRLVTPDTLALALTEYPPVVTVGINVTPGVLALTDTEFEPTVSTPVTVTPGVLAQTLTEKIPSVIIGTVVEPGVLAHVITPLVPGIVEGQSVVPSTLALTLSGLVPVATPTDNKSISPGLATLTLSSFIPILTTGAVVTPGVIDLVISLHVPSAFASYLAEYVHTQLRSLGIETDLNSVQQITDLLIKNIHTKGEFV